MQLFSSLIFCYWTFILGLRVILFSFQYYCEFIPSVCPIFNLNFCKPNINLILTFSGNVFYYSFFYVNTKYILLAFLFLLLSCREKNHFVINGSQIYVPNTSETIKYWVGIRRGIVCLMDRKNSSALGGSLSRDGVFIKIPVVV